MSNKDWEIIAEQAYNTYEKTVSLNVGRMAYTVWSVLDETEKKAWIAAVKNATESYMKQLGSQIQPLQMMEAPPAPKPISVTVTATFYQE